MKSKKKVEKDKDQKRKEKDLVLDQITKRIRNDQTHLKAIDEIEKRKISTHLNLLDNYKYNCKCISIAIDYRQKNYF